MDQSVESVGYKLTTEQFERFRRLVRERAGIALRPEKQLMVCSRLAKRLRELQLDSFDAYFAIVTDRGSAELEHMLNAITTNLTSFFREAHHFQELRERLVEPWVQAGKREKLRIWSAGCSTGEEPYTILMTIAEGAPDWQNADVKLLASDLDSSVLATGERAVYPEERVEDLAPELRDRYFIEGSGEKLGQVRLKRALREAVSFRRINFVQPTWPIHTKFDAIFCRNALIYFDSALQKQIVQRLLSYLKPNGLLFLGHSESLAGVRPDLESLGRTTYRYTGTSS